MSAEAETKVFDMGYDKPVTLTQWEAQWYSREMMGRGAMLVKASFAPYHPDMAQGCETFDAAKLVVNNHYESILSDFWIVSYDATTGRFEWAEIYVGSTLWRVEPIE